MSLYGGVRIVDWPSPENVRRLDMGCVPMVLEMQRRGLLVDKEYYAHFSKELAQECDQLTEKIKSMTGHYINVASPDQVAALLFDKLKLKPPPNVKKTSTGKRYSVDDEVLETMKQLHPVVPLVTDYRERDKLKDSYADVLPILARLDGRVRTTLRLTRIVSGRIASSNPNLTAQPVRTELGKRIRKGFIASPGRVMVALDLSQIEMRMAAHEARCWNMINVFSRDGDIHSETASRMFHLPIDKLDKMEHRYPAKRVGFGVLFGLTPEGLMNQMIVAGAQGWDIDRCAEMIRLWFEAYPEINSYMAEQHSRARRFLMIWDMVGRHRLTPGVKSVHKRIVEEALRAVGNYRIQSGAQAIIKLQMAAIHDMIQEMWGEDVWPLLQIHDELLFEVKKEIADDFIEMAGAIMSGIIELVVPIRWSAGKADNWGDLER